jgi:serine/threonine protein kinase
MTNAGTLGTSHFFQAPELHTETYDQKVDVFAFGMIFWEIMMGRPVASGFPGGATRSAIVHLIKIGQGERPSTDDLSAEAVSICDVTLEPLPEDRFTFAGLLDHFKANSYAMLPDVAGDEVAAYVARIENYEARYPPVPQEGNDAE